MKLALFTSNGQTAIGIVVGYTIVPLPEMVGGVGGDMKPPSHDSSGGRPG